MKIHHINCETMKISKIFSAGRIPDHAVCHCLLIETGQGLVLIDSGIGTRDMVDPSRLGPTGYLLPLREDMDETALNQVLTLGYKTDDVRHIILTHLDLDHTGGIPDFPHAAIHVLLDE
ncbi:MAG: MBL fold metallo-hydrolase, partial [Desulfomonilia bacterium]|nr:MBL fold metallo-hydrolase [Desulfomonilia bacterium]